VSPIMSLPLSVCVSLTVCLPQCCVSLFSVCESLSDLIDQRTIYKKGQLVQIKQGPLKDLIGILEKPVSASGRVHVLFKLFKYPLRAHFKCEDITLAVA